MVRKKLIFSLMSSVSVALPLYLLYPPFKEGIAKPSINTVIQRRDLIETMSLNGIVSSEVEITIKAPHSGYLSDILVEEGDQVEKDNLIAVQALVSEKNELKIMEKKIEIGKVERELLNRELQRGVSLYQVGGISRVDVEKLKHEVKVKSENIEILEKEKQIKNQEIESRRIKTPIDGRVIKVMVERGERLTPGQEVAIVSDTKKKVVTASVDGFDIKRYREGMPVELDIRGEPVEGRVSRIDKRIERKGSVLSFEISITSPDFPSSLVVGEQVKVKIIDVIAKDRLVIPKSFMTFRGDTKCLIIKEGDDFNCEEVRVGIETSDYFELLESSLYGRSVYRK